jgi:hypothetical protein
VGGFRTGALACIRLEELQQTIKLRLEATSKSSSAALDSTAFTVSQDFYCSCLQSPYHLAVELNNMRSYALVALLATSLFFISADASRQLAQDALSNSNGCLNTIPKCEAGACATRNIMGVARWVCLRCRGGYEPVVTADGQDNIVQCGEFDRTEAALKRR